jgi:CDP-6-deoxy-D-xylo-4-hexulose-3-dehydrase
MIDKELERLIYVNFKKKNERRKFEPGKTPIKLAVPSYNADEIINALDSMLSTQVSMGRKVQKFEEEFSNYVGCKHGIMVNSGSSANLIALSVLTNPAMESPIEKDSFIITPSVTWATTVLPIVNVGCKPLFVDVDLDTFCVNPETIKNAIDSNVSCVLPVHLVGNPCDMSEIAKITKTNDLYLVEDCCEALGAKIDGKNVGSFGDIGTYSFFMSHHITTIEGGMLVSNNDSIADMSKMLRAFGWTREAKDKEEINSKYHEIDPRFLFVNLGYNLRPTEIQGAFGLNQIKKLDNLVKIRRENAKYWNDRFSKHEKYFILPKRNLNNHAYFGYAITIKENAPFKREELINFLESKKIDTRPIMAGNYVEQPASKLFEWKQSGNLTNSELIMKNSFFIGNHHEIGNPEREYVADVFDEFLNKYD